MLCNHLAVSTTRTPGSQNPVHRGSLDNQEELESFNLDTNLHSLPGKTQHKYSSTQRCIQNPYVNMSGSNAPMLSSALLVNAVNGSHYQHPPPLFKLSQDSLLR